MPISRAIKLCDDCEPFEVGLCSECIRRASIKVNNPAPAKEDATASEHQEPLPDGAVDQTGTNREALPGGFDALAAASEPFVGGDGASAGAIVPELQYVEQLPFADQCDGFDADDISELSLDAIMATTSLPYEGQYTHAHTHTRARARAL